jgi:bifunctional non-homologous end joining protein LigD
MGLASFVKTSGNKGLHLLVPLNRKETTFEDTKTFSKAVAGIMQKHYPDLVTARMAKPDRKAKVFINWSQNDASKTMICVYSLRAREKPFVSFPLEWKDLEKLAEVGDPERLQVMHSEALSEVDKKGDLFQEVLMKVQKLPHL